MMYTERRYYRVAIEAKAVYNEIVDSLNERDESNRFFYEFNRRIDAFAGNSITRRAMMLATIPDEFWDSVTGDPVINWSMTAPATRWVLARFKMIKKELSSGKLKFRRALYDPKDDSICLKSKYCRVLPNGHIVNYEWPWEK